MPGRIPGQGRERGEPRRGTRPQQPFISGEASAGIYWSSRTEENFAASIIPSITCPHISICG